MTKELRLNFNKAEYKDSSFYVNDVLYSGILYEIDGDKRLEATYKDGIQNGEARTYLNDKKIKSSMLKNGEYNGVQKEFFLNGKIKSERLMKNGKADGLHNEWYEEGQLKSERLMKNGKANGLHKEWYEEGQLKSEKILKDDKLEGTEIHYYQNGKIKKKSYFLEGIRYNNIEEFDNDGKLINTEKCIFSNKEFKKELTKYQLNKIINFDIDITLIKGCAYETIEFWGEYKGYEYTVYGRDLGKWCDTEYEGEKNIKDFVNSIEDAEIDKLDSCLDFSFFPNDSWGFSGDKIKWEENTPDEIMNEIKKEDPDFDDLISDSLDNSNYENGYVELYNEFNNILNIKISFKHKNSEILLKWYNKKNID